MDIVKVGELVTDIGFPAVMCGILLYYCFTLNKMYREELNDFRESLERNTTALTKILDFLTMKNGDEIE